LINREESYKMSLKFSLMKCLFIVCILVVANISESSELNENDAEKTLSPQEFKQLVKELNKEIAKTKFLNYLLRNQLLKNADYLANKPQQQYEDNENSDELSDLLSQSINNNNHNEDGHNKVFLSKRLKNIALGFGRK
jgi:hypothetical protein